MASVRVPFKQKHERSWARCLPYVLLCIFIAQPQNHLGDKAQKWQPVFFHQESLIKNIPMWELQSNTSYTSVRWRCKNIGPNSALSDTYGIPFQAPLWLLATTLHWGRMEEHLSSSGTLVHAVWNSLVCRYNPGWTGVIRAPRCPDTEDRRCCSP